ncbi:hypothetical protein DFH08DRAFT_731010 [Mycena albidolilacea]|uniref:Uncharacterized protein n=1 Tax=Mycena albidolilacea TaxID=1033008 RepID=A0AAD7APC3_9AGAR|nr:hypothetical protein DFH08DRAFT_731010 [Mycena albidolilacea]
MLSNIPPPAAQADAVDTRLAPSTSDSAPAALLTESSWLGPFRNSTIFGLMNWMWTGSAMKSIQEMVKLIAFLRSDEFQKSDLEGFDIAAETAKLDDFLDGRAGKKPREFEVTKDGWQEVSVDILVPDGKTHTSYDDIPVFTVPGLHFRNLTEVIKAALHDQSSRSFHYTPFKHLWKSSTGDVQRVYDEIYSSDAFIEAYNKLQKQPPEPGCSLERVIVALMFWSDSTHLANFGTASLWPLYLFFGNLSKWVRSKPRAGACHHVAYLPKLPDEFNDWCRAVLGEAPTSELLTHCRRELMHAIWKILLDDDFINACKHGVVIECPDAQLAEMGTVNDQKRRVNDVRVDDEPSRLTIASARDWIYQRAYGIKSAMVEKLLTAKSMVPTLNAFSCLNVFGLSIYTMLVVDFMHEFELGVWKSVFVHLIRILFANGGDAIQQLNQRYRMVPTFGRSTIRRFVNNASAMKKLAARNFEDLLQCAMPVFEGLLDEPHNKVVLDLLFLLAYWHALAKLRMHTSFSLGRLDEVTASLGRQLRYFAKYTCSKFVTKELPSEEAARGRRQAKKAASANKAGRPAPAAVKQGGASNQKTFNLFTYKWHSLGDYVRTIRFFGTTDSYSTQTGELEHRRVKRFYARTNKNNAVRQMTRLERREQALLRLVRRKAAAFIIPPIASVPESTQPQAKGKKPRQKGLRPALDFAESESLPYTSPELHHHISPSRNHHFHLPSWLADNAGDPALANFLPKLQDHLLSRLAHPNFASDNREYAPEEQARLLIRNDRLYRHKVFRVNYTTYDVRTDQDSMNPRNHADIMMLAPESDDAAAHSFVYARILGIYHADVIHNVPGAAPVPAPIEFLWVRWFRLDGKHIGGFKRKRLHRLEFVPDSEPGAYGFVNPDDVIRGAHLIPAFHYGATEDASGPSFSRPEGELDDWVYHYVNFFVDRDMFMRYLGGGVGHYQVPVPDVAADDGSELGSDGELAPPGDDSESNSDSSDDSSDDSSEEHIDAEGQDSNDADAEVTLGPEDGEDGMVDLTEEFGYAAL